jgi:hypothetical protein
MTRPRGRQWVGVAYSLSYLTEDDTEEEGKDEEDEEDEEKEEKPLAEPLEVQVRAESAVGGTRSPDMTTGPDPARGGHGGSVTTSRPSPASGPSGGAGTEPAAT